MKTPTPAELHELNQIQAQRMQVKADFDDGKILDFSGRDANYATMVRGMGDLLFNTSNRITGLYLTMQELDIPIDLDHMADCVRTLEAYANTLQGYVRMDYTGALCLN